MVRLWRHARRKDQRLEISPNISFLHICCCMEPRAHAEVKILIKVPPACRPAAREEGAPQGPTGVQAGSAREGDLHGPTGVQAGYREER